MRKKRPAKRPIDALFSSLRQQVLAAFFRQPERWWFLSELASQIGTAPSSLQREVENLATSGLLLRRRDGKRTYYRPDAASPIFHELRSILQKTLGVPHLLSEALRRFDDRIDFAFVHGSVAEERDRARSDVDLIVVGSVGLAELSPEIGNLEERLAREINPMVLTAAEFAARIKRKDHFLTSILTKGRVFVKGGEDDLAAVVDR